MLNETTQNAKNLPRRNPPGPSGYPIVGVAPRIGKDFPGFLLKMAVEYGGITLLELGPKRTYFVTQPEYLKQILVDNNRNYVKGYDAVKPLFGDGLLTSDGDTWFRQRRLMQPAFHHQQLASFANTMIDFTAQMLDQWDIVKRNNQPIDVAAEMMGLTQKIILKTMFSADANANMADITLAFDIALNHFNNAMFSPLSQITWLPTAANRRYHWALRTLDEVVYAMITDRRTTHRDESDLLTMLMNARDADTGEGMSDKQIRDEMMTIFLAGHETTATTLSWAWHLLSQHPEAADKLKAEVATVLDGRAPTVKDLPNLTYTRMIIEEAMRLYPPAWMFARVSVNPDVIGGFDVPAGSLIMLSPYVTHHLPSIWNDPEKFDPGRFTPEQAGTRHKYAYLPFSGGPRICIGNSFAMMEAQLIMAMIVQKYQFHTVPGREVTPLARATMRPFPGVWMTL